MNEQTKPAEPEVPVGEPIITVGDNDYMQDAQGKLVPLGTVKPQHVLEDQSVRKIISYAEELNKRIARFRDHTFDDVTEFLNLLAEQYGGQRGGRKGNITLTSYDGTRKVVIQVQDHLDFGPELNTAKGLVDECIRDWGEGSHDHIRALVEHAFQVDKHGQINRAQLFKLGRLEIDDPKWVQAMQALRDAVRVVGSKEYVRFYKRASNRDRWEAITIDLAKS